MSLAAVPPMLRFAFPLAVFLASAAGAPAMTLVAPRVDARLYLDSAKDRFRIRAQLAGIDPNALAAGPLTLRFGPLQSNVPAGGFHRRGNKLSWRSDLLGVKKMSIDVRKSTLDVVGGGIELGSLPAPMLGLAMPHGVACGRVIWNGATTIAAAHGGRVMRKTAAGPLAPCVPTDDGTDHTPPHVLVTTPTPLDGAATASATIDLGGTASDDSGAFALSWTNDRGGGGSLAAAAAWTLPAVPLLPGDNRITVTATDGAENAASDDLVVTYNTNGLVFDGVPVAEPDALFVGTPVRVAIREGIVTNTDLDPDTITLHAVGADGSTSAVATLKDDGVVDTGDRIAGDGIYAGEVRILAQGLGTERFRVSARTKSNPVDVAWSPIVSVPIVDHVSQQDLDAAIHLANDARATFAGLSADGVASDEAIDAVVAMAHVYGAQVAGPSDGGLGAWWVDGHGILGGMLAYDTTARRGGGPSPAARRRPAPARDPAPSTPSPLLQVGTRRSLMLAPYFSGAEPATVGALFAGSQCPQFVVESYAGSDASAERFKHLEEYGVILIASHGDALFDDVGAAYRSEWGWSTAGGQTVVLTGTTLDYLNRTDYERDLRLGRMAVFPDAVAGVLPNFITRYSVRLPQSLVYVGACRSTASETLAVALTERGAATFVGYDGYVSSAFAESAGTDFFTQLLTGKTVAEALVAGTDGGTPASSQMLLGRPDASLTADPIINGGFEITSGFENSVTGFTVTGNARIVGLLGSTLPTDGTHMALVSTGNTSTGVGTFVQPVCLPPLPPGATTMRLSFDWNFFSEEFTEYCGSQYQDTFEVRFGPDVLQSTRIDDVCGIVTPADVHFDQGPTGTVWKTGWLTSTIDVTALAGTTAPLSFGAADVSDKQYDSVILVDQLRISTQ